MKFHLFVAGIVATIITISPPVMAAGLGPHADATTLAVWRQQPGQLGTIWAHDKNSWNGQYYPPWSFYDQPFRFPGSGWYGGGYYGSPFWGTPYGNNYYYDKPRRLTERQVVYAVKAQHFHHITKVWFDDGVYKVRAVDYYGRPVQLLVDPYNGGVLRWSFRR